MFRDRLDMGELDVIETNERLDQVYEELKKTTKYVHLASRLRTIPSDSNFI